jgi:glycosyltransferase involved in cell wall biosynthesis
MHLGVVPLLNGSSGGVYQYSLTILKMLNEPGVLKQDDVVTLFVHDPKDAALARFKRQGWRIRPLSPPGFRRSLAKGAERLPGFRWFMKGLRAGIARPQAPSDIDKPARNPRLRRWFERAGVDLMLYPVPMSIAFECGLPYVFTVHDLQHRLQPHFPEVGEAQEWNDRERLFRNGVRNALAVIADSETGRQDVLSCYGDCGVSDDSVFALPFIPAEGIRQAGSDIQGGDARRRYNLPKDYFFYPAQFWPHKNHLRLFEALAILKQERGVTPDLVLCGSHQGPLREQTFNEAMRLAREMGVIDQIRYLGFVPDDDMAALYAGAHGLLMPTFFGPTNIPILEAWALGCPVMTSNIRGVRDQAGDAALLVDPLSAAAMAEAMYRLWTDPSLREELSKRGRSRIDLWTPADFTRRLSQILSYARHKLLSLDR